MLKVLTLCLTLVFVQTLSADDPPKVDTLTNLIKRLETAAGTGDSATIARLYPEPFKAELLKLIQLQDELSKVSAALEKQLHGKFGERPVNEHAGVVIRIATAGVRHKSIKAVLEIVVLVDESSQDRAVLRITEKDDIDMRWFRTQVAKRHEGVWQLVPPAEVYQQVLLRCKVKALEVILQAYRNTQRDFENGKLSTRAEVEKSQLAAAEEYIKATEAGQLRNRRIQMAPPVRMLALGYDEVEITRTTRIRLIKGGLPKDNRPSELGTRLTLQDVRDRISALKSSNPKTRELAAHELGKIGPPAAEAIPSLTELLDDKDIRVAEASLRALIQIAR
ncbi:MAG: HEAT repeat domain-containing protein [Planctomycetia bacterium]|nr:HEAT repeat domain-containing protein [Planctomycetia bacterium]